MRQVLDTCRAVLGDSGTRLSAGARAAARRAAGGLPGHTEAESACSTSFAPTVRASLWLGRNEDCGLRCVYHGWKFDVEGNCVDQMNEPEQFKEKIFITSYPTVELGGVIWAYMGPPELQPPPPKFEWTQVPESHCVVTKVWQECNWLQALEGGIDTSHAPILHRTLQGQHHHARHQHHIALCTEARRRTWSSIPRTMATATLSRCQVLGSGRGAYSRLPLCPALPPDPPASHRGRGYRQRWPTYGCP